MRRALPFLPTALLAAALALAAGCRGGDAAPTADVLLDSALARYVADMGDVRDFTVVGDTITLYYLRVPSPDSLPAFEFRAVTNDSIPRMVTAPLYALPAVPSLVGQLRTGARLLEETSQVSGHPAYVLEVTDPGLFLGGPDRSGAAGFAARALFDAATYRLVGLRLETPHHSDEADTTQSVQQTFRYGDFQTADGLTLPHRATIVSRVPVSSTDLMVGMGRVGMLRQQAQQMPPERRAAIMQEADRAERRLQTGVSDDVFVVRAVRVNTGVPAGLFAPPPPPPGATE